MGDKEEQLKILKAIGEILRADLKGLSDDPPPPEILLQVLHLIRREQDRSGIEPVSWEELPDDVRHLLERLKSGKQGPTEL
jgi:hypothetical protein